VSYNKEVEVPHSCNIILLVKDASQFKVAALVQTAQSW